jgi:hypothetical protein
VTWDDVVECLLRASEVTAIHTTQSNSLEASLSKTRVVVLKDRSHLVDLSASESEHAGSVLLKAVDELDYTNVRALSLSGLELHDVSFLEHF